MRTALVGLIVILLQGAVAFADCTSSVSSVPVPLGTIQYHSNALQLCQGTYWQAIPSTTAGSTCSSSSGTATYEAGSQNYKLCNNGAWHNFDAGTETADTCENVGALSFKSDLQTMALKSNVANSTKWKALAGGYSHTCGIRDGDGRIFCWGDQDSGRLGNGLISSFKTWPVALTSSFSDLSQSWADTSWTAISAGTQHTCAIRSSDKRLFCWGSGGSHRLGNGSNAEQSVPTVVATNKTWKSVSAGATHTCAIDHADQLYCWGANDRGQVGKGATNAYETEPVLIASAVYWSRVSVGVSHSCAIDDAGRLYCWGVNTNGQVGDGTEVGPKTSPVLVSGASTLNSGWKDVTVGNDHSCGLKNSGQLFCWGLNKKSTESDIGRVGVNKTDEDFSIPQLVSTGWSMITSRGDHSCGVKSSGDISCWGDNSGSQLGTGTSSTKEPVLVIGNPLNPSLITAGFNHTCILGQSGQMLCWGGSTIFNKGQLGNGLTTQSAGPVDVIGGKLRFCRENSGGTKKWYQPGL